MTTTDNRPRVILFGNGDLTVRVLRQMKDWPVRLVGVVLHDEPKEEERITDAITAISGDRASIPVVKWGWLNRAGIEGTDERIAEWVTDCDVGLSVLFGHKLGPLTLAAFPRGIVNVHPSLLPSHRGEMPNVWSIIERGGAGVTAHLMDESIDTGPIIGQSPVPILATDTGQSLYLRMMDTAEALVGPWFLGYLDGRFKPYPQGSGCEHRRKDVKEIDNLGHWDADGLGYANCLGRALDVIRARTFPPYEAAYFTTEDGKKVYVRVQLEEAKDK